MPIFFFISGLDTVNFQAEDKSVLASVRHGTIFTLFFLCGVEKWSLLSNLWPTACLCFFFFFSLLYFQRNTSLSLLKWKFSTLGVLIFKGALFTLGMAAVEHFQHSPDYYSLQMACLYTPIKYEEDGIIQAFHLLNSSSCPTGETRTFTEGGTMESRKRVSFTVY